VRSFEKFRSCFDEVVPKHSKKASNIPDRDSRNARGERQDVVPEVADSYSNQSKAAWPSMTHIPMTRPVNPVATWVDR
jgi:hypothetical protein